MSIYIDAYCENCGSELNIYQEWDGSNFRVTPCENCISELTVERNVLQAKLDELDRQITELANYIINYVPGEPSQSEGVIDCTIRIITELQAKLDNVIDELKLVKEQISKGADPTPLETYRFVSDLLKEIED